MWAKKRTKQVALICVSAFGLLVAVAIFKMRQTEVDWVGGCNKLTTCNVLRVGGRARLFASSTSIPKEGYGYVVSGNSATAIRIKEGVARTSRLTLFDRNSTKAYLVRNKARLFVQTRDIHIKKLVPTDLISVELVELVSTRPEIVDIPFLQMGGYTNGKWLYLQGLLIDQEFYVVRDKLWTYN